MGNESSKALIDDDTPTETLENRSLEAIAKYIKEKNVRRIVVLTGAGISTAAGIPDFRSPDTGIYANLARLDLPDPEAVFDISYFRENPLPFYSLARDMMPGKFKPTLTHCFVKLLYDKGRLLKLFTQNIDCLEREAGVPGEMIVEAHGSFATHSCIECKAAYPDDKMRKALEMDEVPQCSECKGLVKPDIVFFGEALPSSFFANRTLTADADLCIVMGTSLKVFPFAGLPSLCAEGVPRLLINLDRVGGFGSRPDDVLLLGECDNGVMQLAEALGWREELETLFAEINPDKAGVKSSKVEGPPPTRDEQLRDEVDRLTEEIDHTLHLSRSHEQRTKNELRAKQIKEEGTQEEAIGDKSDSSDSVKGANANKHTEEDEELKKEAQLRKKSEVSSPKSSTPHYSSKDSEEAEEGPPDNDDSGGKSSL